MIKYTNAAELPKVIKDWLVQDTYDGYTAKPNVVSATTLLKSPKKQFLDNLARTKDEVITRDVQTRTASKTGTAVHDSIELFIKETQPEGVSAEQRHYRKIEVDGVWFTISAKYDCIEDGVMMDWKNTSPFAHNDLKKMNEWREQLSICRWAVLPKLGELKNYGVIVAFMKGFSQANADKQAPFSYPTYPAQPYNFELMSYEETEEFIRNRIRAKLEVTSLDEANSKICTPEDLWTVGGQYKYFSKPENLRATKVSDNLAELQKLKAAKGGVIIEPAPKACTYCDGKNDCLQYQGFVNKGLFDATKSF